MSRVTPALVSLPLVCLTAVAVGSVGFAGLAAARAQDMPEPSAIAQSHDNSVETEAAATPSEPAVDTAEMARRLLTPLRKPRCDENAADGAIVVCGNNGENARQRLPLRDQLDSARATADGLPRAPNMFGIGNLGGVSVRGCFLPPCPPAVMPDIDFAALPPAPAGSDADRIAKGEVRAP